MPEEKTLRGWKNLRWVSSDHGVFADIHYTLVDSIAEDGKVVVFWIVEATHDKEFRGIPATHNKFETVGVHAFHFKDGKIKEAWNIVNGLTPALELGVVKILSKESK